MPLIVCDEVGCCPCDNVDPFSEYGIWVCCMCGELW